MKTTRAAFLYLEPDGEGPETFAQCVSCRLFVPSTDEGEPGRCTIHGADVEIYPDDSCGFWLPDGLVTPEQSGLVAEPVQCRRCDYAEQGARRCGLYAKLNRLGEFDLDTAIQPHACCNAWTKRKPASADRRYGRPA